MYPKARALRAKYYHQYGELDVCPGLPYHWISGLWINRKHRNQGHAKALLEQVCADADADGISLRLAVMPCDDNVCLEDLYRLYEGFGFRRVSPFSAEMHRKPQKEEGWSSSTTGTSRGSCGPQSEPAPSASLPASA